MHDAHEYELYMQACLLEMCLSGHLSMLLMLNYQQLLYGK